MFKFALNIRTGTMQQYVKQPPVGERQTEWMQEQLFRESGPYYHLNTKPLEKDLIFQDDEERKAAMNFIAITAKESHIDILAFALMSNHFHFIIRGQKVDGLAFFQRMKKRLAYFLARKGRSGVLDPVTARVPDITSLSQLRNEVAYVIRNPCVVIESANPFAYPWCSGYLCFNPFLMRMTSKPVETLTYRERRNITHSADTELDPSFRVQDGMIVPESFVNYRLVENLFPSARRYSWWVLKNVEAQVEVASRLGEQPNLSDDELFIVTMRLCKSRFGANGTKELTGPQRKQLAVLLKNDWCASNGQLARLAQLPLQEVNALFPLTAKALIP